MGKKIIQKIRNILLVPFLLIIMFFVWVTRKCDEIRVKKEK